MFFRKKKKKSNLKLKILAICWRRAGILNFRIFIGKTKSEIKDSGLWLEKVRNP